MRPPRKEMRQVIKAFEALGWFVARRTHHIQMKHPDGYHYTVPCTPKNDTACRKKCLRDLAKFTYST